MQKSAAKGVETLRKSHIFKDVTEQTLHLIVHEMAEEKVIASGTLLCKISKRSIFGDKKKEPQVNKVAVHSTDTELLSNCKTSKELVKTIGSQFVEESDGFYVILEGKCAVKNPRDGFIVCTIQTGDFFGESEFLSVMGYNYFGEILTATNCKFTHVSRYKLQKIPEYDQKRMRDRCAKSKGHLTKLVFHCTERYGGNPYEIVY